MMRIEAVLDARRERKAERRRRGPRRQRRRRDAERVVRISALVFLRWVYQHGLSLAQAADRLGIEPSTVRGWRRRWQEDHLRLRERGRPVDPVSRPELWSFLAVFGLIGPQVGLPTLQGLFPEMTRAALLELQDRCRAIYRRRAARLVHTLRWTRPGTVWAMDFSDPPEPIEGLYKKLLVVRDLASGKILIAIPAVEASAKLVIAILESLFRWLGPPLVIKCDNGSAFIADEVKACLREHGVQPLYSPPGTPPYNGSIEAGIGSIKVRAFWQAALHDRPGQWTCDDIEAAVAEANTMGRPRQLEGPSPHEVWLRRQPITEAQRRSFREACARYAREEYTQRGLWPMTKLQHREQAAIDRVAVSRALIEQGFLLIRRRRITPPISVFRSRKIS